LCFLGNVRLHVKFKVEIDAEVMNAIDRLNCLVGDHNCFVGVG